MPAANWRFAFGEIAPLSWLQVWRKNNKIKKIGTYKDAKYIKN